MCVYWQHTDLCEKSPARRQDARSPAHWSQQSLPFLKRYTLYVDHLCLLVIMYVLYMHCISIGTHSILFIKSVSFLCKNILYLVHVVPSANSNESIIFVDTISYEHNNNNYFYNAIYQNYTCTGTS